MHEYTPANTPGLPAGWEINLYESEDYINLSLWRVRAFLNPYKEDRTEDYALIYSCSRYSDAYLPVGYTQEEVTEAIHELVWKATQFDTSIAEYEDLSNLYPMAVNRPSRHDYFTKRLYRRNL